MNKQTEALKHLDYADRFLDAGMYAQAQDEIQACKEALEQPAPSWQGLSDDDIQEELKKMWDKGLIPSYNIVAFARAIEQALRNKNGY